MPNHDDLCENCVEALLPGIIFPMATREETDRAYVERCDECRLFEDDDKAGTVLAIYLGKRLEENDVGLFIDGMTFEEAQALKKQRYVFP